MKTIIYPGANEIKIQRSRFIACLYPVANPDEARKHLSEHAKQYADATHNCYAYICGFNGEVTYYSDAGEPGGTAGKPILNVLLRAELTNILAVVTRYYGGIKLGVKGLIEAYGSSVEAAVQMVELVIARQMINYEVTCDYSSFEHLKHKATELQGSIIDVHYGQSVSSKLSIPAENNLIFIEILDGYRTQSRLDYKQTQ